MKVLRDAEISLESAAWMILRVREGWRDLGVLKVEALKVEAWG